MSIYFIGNCPNDPTYSNYFVFQVVGAWAQTQEVTEEIEKFRAKNQRQRQRRSRLHKNKE